VWTGTQAKELGLVDSLGGFYHAIELAKTEAGIPAEQDPELMFLPKRKGWWQELTESLATTRNHALPRFVRQILHHIPVGLEPGPAAILADAVTVQ
jgi:ClpP class serine protease